jgi:acyl transferase domain-containing protein
MILSPKKVARNTPRKGNFVTHLTSSEHMKNAKQSHEQRQKPATKVPEKQNKKPQARKTYATYRNSSESGDDTLCGFSEIARRSPLSTLKGDWIQYQ